MQVVSEPQAFLSNQQPPFGAGPLEVVTKPHRWIVRVTPLFTKCARELAVPLPSDKSSAPARKNTRCVYRFSRWT